MTGPVLSRREPSTPALARPNSDLPVPDVSTVSDTVDTPVRGHCCDRDPAARGVCADIARAGSAATVVSCAGAVDVSGAHVLAAAIAGAVSAGAGERIVLELNRVTYLGACGLGVILAAHADAPRRDAAVVLVVDEVAPAAATLWPLRSGRGPEIYSTLDAALRVGEVPA